MSIIIRNMARVKVPEDKLAQVLRMYLYEGRDGSRLKNYKYTPSNGYAYLPLNYEKLVQVSQLLGEEIIDERSEGLAISQPFVVKESFKFRDYQVEPAFELLGYIRANNYGVLAAGCGCGKTVVMSWVAGQLGKRILVLVDMSSLAIQWQEAFQMIYGITPQIITKDTTEFADVNIATFQLLHVNPELLERMREAFGVTIVDEFHAAGSAETFKEVMFKINNKYRIGGTATFRKKNFSDYVLADLVSFPSVEMIDHAALKCEVKFIDTGSKFYSSNPDDWGRTMSRLAKDKYRNDLIIKVVSDLATAGRKVLLAGITKEQLGYIVDQLKRSEHCKPLLYVGTTSAKQDVDMRNGVENGKYNIVATVSKFSKGTDAPALDCLLFAKPSNNQSSVEQLAGRIVRKLEGKPTPLVVDLVDNSDLAKRFANNRRKWYRQLGYTILD